MYARNNILFGCKFADLYDAAGVMYSVMHDDRKNPMLQTARAPGN